ncbi:hypothetical protein LEN26_013831 [Aphanomyces euteiches]|nr:hypothetical protein LEN26_013831 [Aphanomyces euteiches]
MGGTMSLNCVVVGEGTPFPVEIKSLEKVGVLKKKIKEGNENTIACDAKDLKLYSVDGLVHKSAQFVFKGAEINYFSVKLLSDFDGSTEELAPLSPLYSYSKLNDTSSGKIHVLVVRPVQGAVASAALPTTQVVQTMRYQHSKMNSTICKKLLRAMNIHLNFVKAVPFFTSSDSTPVEPFTWASVFIEGGQEIQLTEEQQRKRYLSYVEENIGAVLAEKELCVLGVEKMAKILDYAMPEFNIELVGRTDLLVLSDMVKSDPDILQFLPGVRLLIEVKKTNDLQPGSVYQAVSELIALDCIANDPVMALLTDLNGHWEFLWVSEKRNNAIIVESLIITTPTEAFEVIRTLLAQPKSSHEDIQLPCCERPVKRRKLENMLPSVTEGGESNDILESIQRMKDIASVLGPDVEMAREVARQVTRSIPSFSKKT